MSDRDTTAGFVGEWYWPGVTEGELAGAARRLRDAASALRREGGEIEFLGSILVPADETVFCFFHGREADVRATAARAGVDLARLLASLRVDGTRVDRDEAR